MATATVSNSLPTQPRIFIHQGQPTVIPASNFVAPAAPTQTITGGVGAITHSTTGDGVKIYVEIG